VQPKTPGSDTKCWVCPLEGGPKALRVLGGF
jgi:hypothetical protein